MPYQFVPYSMLLVFSAAMISALTAYAVKHRHTLGTNILGLCMVIGIFWSLFNALELSALTLGHKLFWANMQYIAYSLGPVAWFITVCHFTGNNHWIKEGKTKLLLIIPVITMLLVWTDPFWGFVRRGFELDTTGTIPILGKQYGPWFWIHFSQSYILNFLSIALIIKTLITKGNIYRGQALLLLGGIGLVVVTNLLYVLGFNSIADYDVTPIVFSLSGALIFWGIYRFHLFRLIPFAWDKVLEAMESGVVVIDSSHRVVDANPAFYRMFFADKEPASLGMLLEDVSPELAAIERDTLCEEQQSMEIRHTSQGKKRYYELSVSVIHGHLGMIQGRVMLLNDITDLKVTQERLNLEQQELAVAAERDRITKDLHDNLGQILGFSSIQIRAIQNERQRGRDELVDHYLLRLSEVLDEAQLEMRRYVHDLRTKEYQDTSINLLLQKQLQRLWEHARFEPDNTILEIPPCDFLLETKVQIHSIVKEALNNVLKHSQANRVLIQLTMDEAQWRLVIADNGVGFDPTAVLNAKRNSSGIHIMAERARLLGGQLTITSEPGQTKVRVEFPKQKERD